MACRTMLDDDGRPIAIVCTGRERERACSSCGTRTRDGVLCDFPTKTKAGLPRTCDRFCCRKCAVHVGEDLDHCPPHARAAAEPSPAPASVSLGPTVRCKGCGRAIVWKLTVKGKKMPLDPESVPDGNIVINPSDLVVVLDRERIAALEARADRARWPRFVSHFATCTQRER